MSNRKEIYINLHMVDSKKPQFELVRTQEKIQGCFTKNVLFVAVIFRLLNML